MHIAHATGLLIYHGIIGGRRRESNPPSRFSIGISGFEDRQHHRALSPSVAESDHIRISTAEVKIKPI